MMNAGVHVVSGLFFAFALAAGSAQGCTCVVAEGVQTGVLADLGQASIAFRGTVLDVQELPLHPRMRGRSRYRATFRVTEYWKGDLHKAVTLYYPDPGTDCLGAKFVEGTEYLIFARATPASDHIFDDFFWYGWLDVLKEGTPIMEPWTACTATGETKQHRDDLKRLGKGRRPSD